MSEAAPDGEDRMGALPRDPETVYVYWELGGPLSAEVAREMGEECEWVLRVLDLSEGTSTSVPVAAGAGSHYLQVKPGRTYGAELAARVEGKWRTVCRTGRVVMPSGRPVRAASPGVGPPVPPARGGPRRPPSAEPRGEGVPGLDIDTTPLGAGSSSWGGSSPKK